MDERTNPGSGPVPIGSHPWAPSRRALLGGVGALASTALAGAVVGVTARPADAAADPSTGPEALDAAAGSDTTRWATSWATAPVAPTEADAVAYAGFTDTTLRQVLRVSAGGQVRLRFGNPFGTEPVRIGPVSVAVGSGGADVDTATTASVTFGGEPTGRLAAGATLVSDPVVRSTGSGPRPWQADDNSDVVVSVYLPGPTGPVSFHRNVHATGYAAPGIQVADAGARFSPTGTSSYLVAGLDVPVRGRAAVAILGDSIAEGVGTTTDTNSRWPDLLAARAGAGRAGDRRRTPAIANLGISGNRVLLDDARFGASGQARLDRDVFGLPCLATLLVHLGINDIQQPPSELDPGVILAGLDQIVRRARDQGLRVLGATVTPFEGWQRYTPELEQVREQVNDVLIAGGIFDAVVDFDAAVRDPARPTRLAPEFDSGDGLHPNDAGAQALADAVPLRELR
ncbi:SGNH/GDSL hydrolase family protein [Occultella aeris]|uniref:GDSL-like Lipase/Acylhydrolase n=1 Tax=Occultella aeris TaxID=2761496 RepID=A0A7M4DFE9_9MICO|nr:SGNH/GDSL hydrolase family protein [Occultella aeris]VZO35642.1 GDSL-like Lipase/Acylhydrolase [Occultella aeris]